MMEPFDVVGIVYLAPAFVWAAVACAWMGFNDDWSSPGMILAGFGWPLFVLAAPFVGIALAFRWLGKRLRR